jgi:predicted phage baseplate assembly protein
MSLPSPNLDDRGFQDIVDEAKRLIPSYCPEWTNHNLSDPGVALIELFAWMSEMILYRVNQVPDRFYTKFLELVGIELFPATPARTELTFWLSAPVPEPVVVPARTQVGTGPVEVPVVFETDEDLCIVQPQLTACLTSSETDRYIDCWDDLCYERSSVSVFSSTPVRPGDAFYLGFAGSLAGNAVRLDIKAPALGLGIQPSNPPLCWEIWEGEAWARTTVHEDTTGGLNRDGSVTLMVPTRHLPLTLGQKRAWWLRGRMLAPEAGQAPYQASPRIQELSVASLGGTVTAHHSQQAPAEELGRSDGTPSQAMVCRHRPVLPRRAGETVRVITAIGSTDWNEVADFSASEADDLHYTWESTSGEIRFGPRIRYPDGSVRQHGAIPASGATVSISGYRYGGGAMGNVGTATLSVLRTTIPYVDRVENLRAASGGVDAEKVENAKLRGPVTLRTGQRAVTAVDFERLALDADPSVARARCLPPEEPGGPVRLLVVPRIERPSEDIELDDFALADELIERISTYLDERRMLGATVEIGTPYYQGLTVAALVNSQPARPPDLVRQRALDALYRYINPMVGGADGTGWAFDTDLSVASVFQLLASVDGVERVEEVVLFEADLRNRTRVGAGRELVRLDAQSLFVSFEHRVVVR